MTARAIQPTTVVTFRGSGAKPSLIHVFAKGGRKWIIAADVCRIIGIRMDMVPRLVPDQARSQATVLLKGSVESVITVTEEGFDLLVAQSAKPIAQALREWMVGEVLPAFGKPLAPVAGRQGELF